MSGEKLLELLAPPIELMDKLESANMPPSIKAWWERWRDIRSDGESEIDAASQEARQEALLIVEEKTKKAEAY